MHYKKTELSGVWIIEPVVYTDDRGYFTETFKKSEFEKYIGKVSFVQDNESKSSHGVLRGLHFQRGEFAQSKLVRVILGTVLDVAVDMRPDSSTFGSYIQVELSGENKKQLYIPGGFAHGFLVLSDVAVFSYKVDNFYTPEAEETIRYDDPDLAIEWPIKVSELIVSEKDKRGKLLKDIV